MITLFPFQVEAATNIADRYQAFVTDPDRPKRRDFGPLPFYQTLRALTGAGKTPILAFAVSQMRTVTPVEPIILWISKGKVVVDQTLTNFDSGGKYAGLVDRLTPKALRDAVPADIYDDTIGLLLLGTVATFNSKERGDRRIFEPGSDVGGPALWDALIARKGNMGAKRPLIVVYDEGHNLTDQQGNILLELRPDAIVVASATPKLPPRINEMIDALKLYGYKDDELVTSIRTTAVVEAELVKREVLLGGYVTAEGVAISAMLEDHRSLESAAEKQDLSIKPKCIYVCRTNEKGDSTRLFMQRKSPPIRIWRHLVEVEKVNPTQIAVYCDLDIGTGFPDDFTLFRGGDNDYAAFIAGDFRHIIFNLSLQEGWDDPECYLAYIDKSMGSELQVEQVIGRVLRQPGARYYPDPRLNTAGFYIHVDEAGVFREILRNVQLRIAADLPGVDVRSTGGNHRTLIYLPPQVNMDLPVVRLKTAEAESEVSRLLNDVEDYTPDNTDALTAGRVAEVVQPIGHSEASEIVWVERGHGMPVSVEWLLMREIEQQYPAAISVCDTEGERFKRLIHLGSRAARNIQGHAREIVTGFLDHVTVGARLTRRKPVGESLCDTGDSVSFIHSIHAAYSGLNPDELICAHALDQLGWTWYRNPSNGGFSLPLPEAGKTRSFYPDFIVWTETAIWLIDPKGEHLIQRDAGRKILTVENDGGGSGQPPLKVCLITDGRWTREYQQVPSDKGTMTAWLLRSGKPSPVPYSDMETLLRKVVGVKGA